MGIKRVVTRQEAEGILLSADKDTAFVKEIIQKLKDNPGCFVEVDSSDLKHLRNKISYIKKQGVDNDVNHLCVRTAKSDDNNITVLVEWLIEAQLPVAKKKKAKKPAQTNVPEDTQIKQ